jgi:hypothetical protein
MTACPVIVVVAMFGDIPLQPGEPAGSVDQVPVQFPIGAV